MRGAWLWPAFFGFTLLDGILLATLPPYEGAPSGPVAGWLLAGFANLLLIAVVAPLTALALRRRRRDLPQLIATDYTGTALLAGLAAVLLVAGLLHRPAVAAEREREAAASGAVGDYVRAHAPGGRPACPRWTCSAWRRTCTGPACRGRIPAGGCASSWRPTYRRWGCGGTVRWSPMMRSARSGGFTRGWLNCGFEGWVPGVLRKCAGSVPGLRCGGEVEEPPPI